jgi:hypothetical protein
MSLLSEEIAGLEQSIREKFEQYQKLAQHKQDRDQGMEYWFYCPRRPSTY